MNKDGAKVEAMAVSKEVINTIVVMIMYTLEYNLYRYPRAFLFFSNFVRSLKSVC